MNSELHPSLKLDAKQQWYDHSIDQIMVYLFKYQCSTIKAQLYAETLERFNALDMAANYFLFDLIEERLPHRAKMFFAGENYRGKRETILEVMAHIGEV
ncbi:hypothetical protein [Acinetobacter shaoyimingii]|uniref:Uncharacterized protein n=1 Tax=Acinetobacter shaoyimingii TaxID=2715164 RepID=A0A6G8RWT2_9GAMM|nr:hypothetical protein [Acinetobacter shaoyimingii]QIO06364.1 hypothetical protein G8E00_10580 [Acinetobacter shaoyimingii]